ncbi:hypothetical protein GP486_000548 [Trichoglossum hirsutum]|uniref:Uncharacterized protein n=1 Tax=Trichoglossum hirsutum TaxID=265104 RepID=A0A9P8RTG2_9PEZI|nr:hypothetical protein GP486_000548 [Trichoglossum hirsutum]
MATDQSGRKLVFRNPQLQVRTTNVEDIKAISKQREESGGRSGKGSSSPPRPGKSSPTVAAVLSDKYDSDKHARDILNAYLMRAGVDQRRLADPNEDIDDIIAEVVKAKYGSGPTGHPASAEVGGHLELEDLGTKQSFRSLSDFQGPDELGGSDLVMHEIVTDISDGKLYHVDLALPQEFQGASSGNEATGRAPASGDGTSRILRVLEVLCGDGIWCTQLLHQHPDWIVEGIDRIASLAWGQPISVAELLSRASLRDISAVGKDAKDEKGKMKDEGPDVNKPRFTVSSIPSITGLPVPVQTYDFIRGRDIFTTVHDWKLLLDDIHKQLGGAIELIELDPRPRSLCVNEFLQLTEGELEAPYGKSAATTFPEILDDRLKEALDPSLLQESSPWMSHVLRCLGYSSMPDRIYATELKSWVEASGFYQVKEEIIKIPVGDWMEGGRELSTSWWVGRADT